MYKDKLRDNVQKVLLYYPRIVLDLPEIRNNDIIVSECGFILNSIIWHLGDILSMKQLNYVYEKLIKLTLQPTCKISVPFWILNRQVCLQHEDCTH